MRPPLDLGASPPRGWRSLRLKDAATWVNRGIAPQYSEGESDVIAFNQKCVRPDLSITAELGRPIVPGTVPERSPARLRAGDVLVNSTGRGTLGRAAVVRVPPSSALVADGHVTVVRTHTQLLSPRFLAYLLGTEAFYEQANTCLAVGATNQTELNREALRRLRLSVPSLEEQQRIADYLDAETARIDELIAEQQHQRHLLSERHASQISEAVGARVGGPTSPLDGALRDLPEGWCLTPLRTVATIQTGLTLGKAYDGDLEERPYLRVANVQDGDLALDTVTTISVPAAVASRCELRAGDVLMTEGGDNDKLGRGTVWRGQIERCLHQNHVFAVRPAAGRLRPDYLAAVTASAWGRAYFMATAHQTTNLASTNKAKVGNFPLPLPPVEVQDVVLAELESAAAELRALDSELLHQIALLQEHRQALITHAVTQGIDGLPGVA